MYKNIFLKNEFKVTVVIAASTPTRSKSSIVKGRDRVQLFWGRLYNLLAYINYTTFLPRMHNFSFQPRNRGDDSMSSPPSPNTLPYSLDAWI